MEKLSFAKNGVLRLPPGFRFHPTDEELVVQYLKRKVLNFPLPASIIPEFDVCRADPWDLPGDLGKERYFFSTREAKYQTGNRSNRATGSGYWKVTGVDKRVVSPRGNQVVGLKKTLVFYKSKPNNGLRTDWVMHEYRLASQPLNNTTQKIVMPTEKWVLCRIFLKKRGNKTDDEPNGEIEFTRIRCNSNGDDNINQNANIFRPMFFDFLRKTAESNPEEIPSSSSSSGSSGITDVSSAEDSSSCNGLTCFRRNDQMD